jgi:hypothetical protein
MSVDVDCFPLRPHLLPLTFIWNRHEPPQRQRFATAHQYKYSLHGGAAWEPVCATPLPREQAFILHPAFQAMLRLPASEVHLTTLGLDLLRKRTEHLNRSHFTRIISSAANNTYLRASSLNTPTATNRAGFGRSTSLFHDADTPTQTNRHYHLPRADLYPTPREAPSAASQLDRLVGMVQTLMQDNSDLKQDIRELKEDHRELSDRMVSFEAYPSRTSSQHGRSPG